MNVNLNVNDNDKVKVKVKENMEQERQAMKDEMTDKEYFDRQFQLMLPRLMGLAAGMVLCALLTAALAMCGRDGCDGATEVRCDTVVVHDTVRHDTPVYVTEKVVRYVWVPVTAGRDTVYVPVAGEYHDIACDSIALPITQREYTDDSTYTAWVSGCAPRLDSIEVYRRSVTVTKTVSVRERRKWSWGVQGGVYATPRGIQPGIGLGVQYSF